jgi:hypothetical protein
MHDSNMNYTLYQFLTISTNYHEIQYLIHYPSTIVTPLQVSIGNPGEISVKHYISKLQWG